MSRYSYDIIIYLLSYLILLLTSVLEYLLKELLIGRGKIAFEEGHVNVCNVLGPCISFQCLHASKQMRIIKSQNSLSLSPVRGFDSKILFWTAFV